MEQQKPLVAVVILNWNGKDFLKKFLPSVLNSTYPNIKVIVADNGSTDDSVMFLHQNFTQVEIILNPRNEGFAQGYNTALEDVVADYYVLLNSDVEVTPGWIEPIIELMEKDKTIGACQPKMLDYNNKTFFEYAGACGGFMDALGYPFARGRILDVCEEDKNQYNDAVEIFWASGAAFFVRATVFNKLNGFDGFFFAHQEEIDLCWRMQHAGYKIFVCPSSVVYHVGGGTLPKNNPMKIFLNIRNNLIMLYKNLPLQKIIWVYLTRVFLDILAAINLLLKGSFSNMMAVFKGHFNFLKWLLMYQKQSVFPEVKKNNISGIFNGSMLWNYYFLGKKTFSKIFLKNEQ